MCELADTRTGILPVTDETTPQTLIQIILRKLFCIITMVTMTTNQSSLWRMHDYRAWFAGDTSAKFAGTLRTFALPLAVIAMTGSATQAGLIATATQAIGIACMLPGGVITDRFDRRKVLYLFALIGITIWGTISFLFMSEALSFPVLFFLTSLGAANAGLFGETTNAILRTLVQGEKLVKASAANSGRDAALELSGPPLGAALYSLGSWVPFAVSVCGYILLGLCGSAIRQDLHPRAPQGEEKPPAIAPRIWKVFGDDVREGWRYVTSHRTILRLLLPVSVANIGFMGVQHSIMYALVLDGRTPESIALYNMAIAGCALVGSLLAGRFSHRFRTGQVYTVAIPASALALVPTIYTYSYWAVIPCMGLYFAINILFAGHHSIIFSTAPTKMQGRLWAAFGLLSSLPLSIAPTLAGVILDHGSYHIAMAIFFALLFMPPLVWQAMPEVRSLPRPADWATVDL